MIKMVDMGEDYRGLHDGLIVQFFNHVPIYGIGFFNPTTRMLYHESELKKAGFSVESELSETGVRYDMLKKVKV